MENNTDAATAEAKRARYLASAIALAMADRAATAAGARARAAAAPAAKISGDGRWTGCSCGSRHGVIRPSDCADCRRDA